MKYSVAILLLNLVIAVSAEVDFNSYRVKFGKNYVSAQHMQKAKRNYDLNVAKIAAHNLNAASNKETYKMGINKFTELSEEEFRTTILVNFNDLKAKTPVTRAGTTSLTVPANWNRTFLNVTFPFIKIKDQMGCGSCWAFSAAGVYEYFTKRNYAYYADVSEQNLVDCARPNGCNGGWMHECFEYIRSKGINFERIYPYTGRLGTCAYKSTTNSSYGIGIDKAPEWYTIPPNERLMAYIIEQTGWISACLNADLLQSYASGILSSTSCSATIINHAVIFVGFGVDTATNMEYWIARNSWGENWGESGFFRIQRNKNRCGIAYNGWDFYRVHLMKSSNLGK